MVDSFCLVQGTFICIPKEQHLTFVTDYRQLATLKTNYKTYARFLATRLTAHVQDLPHPARGTNILIPTAVAGLKDVIAYTEHSRTECLHECLYHTAQQDGLSDDSLKLIQDFQYMRFPDVSSADYIAGMLHEPIRSARMSVQYAIIRPVYQSALGTSTAGTL